VFVPVEGAACRDIAMEEGQAISGQIADESGKAVVGASIIARRSEEGRMGILDRGWCLVGTIATS
jgi:hypothetical protein